VFSTLQRQVIQCPNNFQTSAAGNQSVQRTYAVQTYLRLIGCAMPMVRRVILPISAPIHALALLNSMCLHLPMEPTMFLLLLSRTMHVGESTMLLWRKPKKLQTLSLVCFLSTTLPQLCYLILKHCIFHICCICWEA
jgi:hypothetical protein